MKYLTAIVAGLLSAVTATTTYEYDPVRAKRAREFYKELVLAEVHKFDESEQAQLFDLEVGG